MNEDVREMNIRRLNRILSIVCNNDPANHQKSYQDLVNGLKAARMRKGIHNPAQLVALRQGIARQARVYASMAEALKYATEIAFEMDDGG